MLVPKTRKLYIEKRHELGREWEMYDASSVTSNPTWGPKSPITEAAEVVLYDSAQRGSVEAIITNMFFEDVFPDVAGTVWGNSGAAAGQSGQSRYFTERQLYTRTPTTTIQSIPMAIFLISADVSSGGDGDGETCLGIMAIGDRTIAGSMGNPRVSFTGVGGKGMPIYVSEGDKLVMRLNYWAPVDGSIAEAAGHTELGLFPAYGNVPMELSDQQGLYNLEQWNWRFFMNCTMETIETTMEERTADELGFA